MNLLQLTLKQMRQRALGTVLTLLSVLLGVALAVSVLLFQRESGALFGQSDFGYELIIGPAKGSDLALTLSTAYYLGRSEGTNPYSLYEQMSKQLRPMVRLAVPFMVGDSYKGHNIVGTSPQMLGYDDQGHRMARPWEYRSGRSFEMAQGVPFHPARFEAVIGSEVARDEHLGVGGSFRATHGMPAPNQTPDVHKPVWKVVGVLKPTHTANDRVLFVPVVSLYAIEEHSSGLIAQAMMKAGYDPNHIPPGDLSKVLRKLGFNPDQLPKSVLNKFHFAPPASQPASQPAAGGELLQDAPAAPSPTTSNSNSDEDKEAYRLDENGNIIPDLPKDEWQLSAILVKTRSPFLAQALMYRFRVTNSEAMAVSPASTMRVFFDTFLRGSTMVLLVLAALVSVVAAMSILVSIYNSVSARQKDIAILRALGATKGKVVGLICLEAALIGLIGGLLGLVVGHLVAGAGSLLFERVMGQPINWVRVGWQEWAYLGAVLVIALLAGLVPAMKAYRVPVATNLVAG